MTHIQPAVVRALATFVSEDETRYALNGILFDCDGETLSVVATDGRRLVIHNPQWEHTKAKCQFILPAFVVEMFPENKTRRVWEIAYDTSTKQIRIVTDDFQITCHAIDCDYPKYRDIIPNPLPTKFPAHALNANIGFLSDVFSLINFLHGNSVHCEPVWNGYGTPVVFEFKDTMILMMAAIPDKNKKE